VTRKRDACYRIGRSATGLGLFATAPIERGAFIVEYSGPRIPTREAHAREKTAGARYMFEINSRWTVDGSVRSNIGRYANHSCRPNAESALGRGKVILRAIKAIKPGDEITYDYGRDYFKNVITPAGCKCRKCIEKRREARRARARAAKRRAARAARARAARHRRARPALSLSDKNVGNQTG
jgi:hypothetical protein